MIRNKGKAPLLWLGVLLLSGCLAACSLGPQIHTSVDELATGLHKGDLETHGIAFVTPSTVTGQEEEKQSVAFIFADVLMQARPDIRCVTLAETLSAVNREGLAEVYQRMFEEYRNSGILQRDNLRQVGQATGSRYVAQIKLAGFSQGSNGRFSAFGLRVLTTKHADIRLFFQIWDTHDGSIVWEGVQEMSYAYDTVAENTVTLRTITEATARQLITLLP